MPEPKWYQCYYCGYIQKEEMKVCFQCKRRKIIRVKPNDINDTLKEISNNDLENQGYIFDSDKIVQKKCFTSHLLDDDTFAFGIKLPKIDDVKDKQGNIVNEKQIWSPVIIKSDNNGIPATTDEAIGMDTDGKGNIYVVGQSSTEGNANVDIITLKYAQCEAPVAFGKKGQEAGKEKEKQSAKKEKSKPEISTFAENSVNIIPNPYNGSTQITYTLKEASEVRIEIYNLMGQRISIITDHCSLITEQEAGTYSYRFSALEAGYAPGMYLLKATINGNTQMYRLAEMGR